MLTEFMLGLGYNSNLPFPSRISWVVLLCSLPQWAVADLAEEFSKEILPTVKEHCYQCHGPDKQKADLQLSVFETYDQVLGAKDVWQKVLERVQAFEMPPDDAEQLAFGERQTFVKWLRNLPKDQIDCGKLASDRTTSFYRGYVMSRRLNRNEYENTIRDLFGVELDVADRLPAEGGGGEGFDNTGNALFVSSIHIEKYLDAAEHVVSTVLGTKDDQPERPAIVRARNRLLAATPAHGIPARESARRTIADFARRAFRRPVSSEEVADFMEMFDRRRARGENFIASLQLPIKAILMSPHFLFLVEPEPEEGGVQALGAFPLASRLSYFIWSSMPDEELLALAESGELLEEEVYRGQIYRMLVDPKAEALGERFALQWLDLQKLGSEVRPDPEKFPQFDEGLRASMQQEIAHYFNHIVRNDRSLLELIDSDYTFVNHRLAGLYDLGDLQGTGWQRVHFGTDRRGGVLGMAAIHTVTSYPLRTSPVLRGKWVLEALLGDKVPPPPPDVPELEETEGDIEHATLRQQLEAHRARPDCASCHDRMDPLGFSLETYDVLGQWRDEDRGHPINAEGTLPSGESFEGPSGLKSLLLERREKVIRNLARKMTGFAFGRELNKYDQCVIDDAWKALKENDFRASVLIETVATSFPFKHRFYPNQKK